MPGFEVRERDEVVSLRPPLSVFNAQCGNADN